MSAVLREGEPHFYATGDFDIPIAGTPEPLPCPFCGAVDRVGIVLGRNEDGSPRAYVECGRCGAESPSVGGEIYPDGYHVALAAAQRWNTRTPAALLPPGAFPPDHPRRRRR